MTLGMNYKEE